MLEYGKKGRLVSLVGRMQQREWTDQQTGEKHTVYEVAGSGHQVSGQETGECRYARRTEPCRSPCAEHGTACTGTAADERLSAAHSGRGRAVSDTGFLRRAGQLCVGSGRYADGQSAVLITKLKSAAE